MLVEIASLALGAVFFLPRLLRRLRIKLFGTSLEDKVRTSILTSSTNN